MKLKTLSGINLKNKSVLLRVDINSPVRKGKISDNPRFKASAKTISLLLKNKSKITIIAHQGRPNSKDFLPLKQHSKLLKKYTGSKIKYIPDFFGQKARKAIQSLKPGSAIILENTRSYQKEAQSKKDTKYQAFCQQFDLYVNDAFSVSHRSQSSIVLPPKYIQSVIGPQFENELSALEKLSQRKSEKTVFILGGSKVDDYFPIFNFLKNKKNSIIASGVLANLLLIAKGHDLGYEKTWLKNHKYLSLLPKLKNLYNKYSKQIILPVDFGLITKENKRISTKLVEAPYKYKVFDIGPQSVKHFEKTLKQADQIFMKGPLGYSEMQAFSYGTRSILSFMSKECRKKFTILGGGHLTKTLEKYKIPSNFSHISLSGGALLKFISGEKLPGIKSLLKSK
jgi:phosphoglycerate kinase